MKYKVITSCLSELIGTALLVGVGLSVVIFINGDGSVIKDWIPAATPRRYITGFLFGTTGCLITLSPVGKISGAHINPTVSFAFFLKKRMRFQHMTWYVISQSIGAIIGSAPLIFWGTQGSSINYGATIPGSDGIVAAFVGETITSFLLVSLIFFFVGHHTLRKYTPFMIPFLFSIMVGIEGNISGTSTNAARSLGPAIIAGKWNSHWIYWTAPFAGASISALLFNTKWAKQHFHIVEARLAYFRQTIDNYYKHTIELFNHHSSKNLL
ncbi:MAG: aquaporin [Chitinophagaceae bacterium]